MREQNFPIRHLKHQNWAWHDTNKRVCVSWKKLFKFVWTLCTGTVNLSEVNPRVFLIVTFFSKVIMAQLDSARLESCWSFPSAFEKWKKICQPALFSQIIDNANHLDQKHTNSWNNYKHRENKGGIFGFWASLCFAFTGYFCNQTTIIPLQLRMTGLKCSKNRDLKRVLLHSVDMCGFMASKPRRII